MNRDCNGDYFSAAGARWYRCLLNGAIVEGPPDRSGGPCSECGRRIDAHDSGEVPTRTVTLAQAGLPAWAGWYELPRDESPSQGGDDQPPQVQEPSSASSTRGAPPATDDEWEYGVTQWSADEGLRRGVTHPGGRGWRLISTAQVVWQDALYFVGTWERRVAALAAAVDGATGAGDEGGR